VSRTAVAPERRHGLSKAASGVLHESLAAANRAFQAGATRPVQVVTTTAIVAGAARVGRSVMLVWFEGSVQKGFEDIATDQGEFTPLV
jgi:hypothetical protein